MAVWSAPVRYAECDQKGVVFDSTYLAYADEAAEHVWRRQGVEYADLRKRALEVAVITSELLWSSPARFG